ncbi:MAG: hypothetical protein PHF37_02005 [Phycisphaerae bacterium]|nr:hypothetical protein [Phycisphaerae bacterium]
MIKAIVPFNILLAATKAATGAASGESSIHQVTLILGILFAAMVFIVPRKYILLPFVIVTCFIPADQRVISMGLDFTPLRFLILAGVVRLLLLDNVYPLKITSIDKILIVWAISGAVIFVIQWGDAGAVIYKCGVLFDTLGLYWIFRKNLDNWDSIRRVIKIFAVCVLFMSVFVAFEWTTGNNLFKYLGAVHTEVRVGRYRCEASFPHSIMLGVFWGTLVPLFAGMAKIDDKVLFGSACGAAVFIVAASASSTPLMALAVAIAGLMVYRFRRYTRIAMWSFVGLLACLHMIMKAPVWHLISRVNVVGGSTGWHRYHLIDKAIEYFNEWALIGTKSTEHWGWGLGDTTNQYILEGIRGGFITLIFFCIMLYLIFKVFLKIAIYATDEKYRWLSWCFFISLAGHCVAFIAVSYFGQIMMLWYLLLAAAGSLGQNIVYSQAPVFQPVTNPPFGLRPQYE